MPSRAARPAALVVAPPASLASGDARPVSIDRIEPWSEWHDWTEVRNAKIAAVPRW